MILTVATQADPIEVRAWSNGNPLRTGAGYGVRLSGHDRDKHFYPAWREVIIDLDGGGSISVSLSESFWAHAQNYETRPSDAGCSATDSHPGRVEHHRPYCWYRPTATASGYARFPRSRPGRECERTSMRRPDLLTLLVRIA
jgi:hypothetical protein